jgi:hypothetical protein
VHVLGTGVLIHISVNSIHISSNNLASTCRNREYYCYQDGTVTVHVPKDNTSSESDPYAKGNAHAPAVKFLSQYTHTL